MKFIQMIIEKKPKEFFLASIVFLIVTSIAKWGMHPVLDTLWFMLGGVVGIYFLDVAETFFDLHPSPFRSILFMASYGLVSFFVTTSSSITLSRGLVLSLFLQLLLWQVGEWRLTGSTHTWYQSVAGPVPVRTQQWILVGFILIFVVETYLFIR